MIQLKKVQAVVYESDDDGSVAVISISVVFEDGSDFTVDNSVVVCSVSVVVDSVDDGSTVNNVPVAVSCISVIFTDSLVPSVGVSVLFAEVSSPAVSSSVVCKDGSDSAVDNSSVDDSVIFVVSSVDDVSAVVYRSDDNVSGAISCISAIFTAVGMSVLFADVSSLVVSISVVFEDG